MLQLAIPADYEAVNTLALQVHAMHVVWRPDIYEMTDALYSEERFAAAVKERQLYVAKIDNVVVGYVLVKMRSYDWPGVVKRKVMLIDEICVHESCRRQGIGRQIIEEVKVLARAFGCTDLELGVYPQNSAAVGLYEHVGMDVKSIQYQMKL